MKTPKFRPDYRIKPKTTKSQAKTLVQPENASQTTVKSESAPMAEVYEVNLGALSELFITRRVAVQSLKLSYRRIARVVPNFEMTLCTVVFDNKSPSMKIRIDARPLRLKPEHL